MTTEQPISVEVKSTAKLDAIWRVAQPSGYDVKIEEPLAKSDGSIGFMTVPAVDVVVALVESGLADWFVSKQAEDFWVWLKGSFGKISSPLGRRGTLKVSVPTERGPSLTVELERMDAAAIDSIRVTAQERIASSSKETKQEIYIKYVKPK